MRINWKVRFANKDFWLGLIPAVCLLVQQMLALGGINWQYDELSVQLIAIVGTTFAILGLLGVVVDPTTPGLSDSERALNYTSPGVISKEAAVEQREHSKI